MPFVLLLVFALLSFQTTWPEPPEWLGLSGALLAPWTLVTLFWLAASWKAYQFSRRLLEDPVHHGVLWRRFLRFRRNYFMGLVVAYLLVLFYLGWGEAAVHHAGLLAAFPGVEAVQIAPLLLTLPLAWARFYEVERTSFELAHRPETFIGRGEYLGFQARHNLLLLVPPLVLYLITRVLLLGVPNLEEYDGMLLALGASTLVLALVSVPLILRLFLGLHPLPDGPLRRRLEATARRLGFRFNDVLVWDTRGAAANAMVSGVVPWIRYVVLTDLLIERLTEEEIEAVFGHEVGHIKHHHMVLYVLFFLGSLVMLIGLWKYVEGLVGADPVRLYNFMLYAGVTADTLNVLAGPVLLFVVSAYMFVVFGYLSRRCESQADLYGCRAVSSRAFIDALEKVADVNGIPRHKEGLLSSWQHPSIAQRVAFIEQVRDDPAAGRRFQRSVGVLKWGLLGVVGLGLTFLCGVLGTEQMWEVFRLR